MIIRTTPYLPAPTGTSAQLPGTTPILVAGGGGLVSSPIGFEPPRGMRYGGLHTAPPTTSTGFDGRAIAPRTA